MNSLRNLWHTHDKTEQSAKILYFHLTGSFHWRHTNVSKSHNTGNSTVCSTTCSANIQNISNIYSTGPLWGESTGGFPSQRASNMESVSTSWRLHVYILYMMVSGTCSRLYAALLITGLPLSWYSRPPSDTWKSVAIPRSAHYPTSGPKNSGLILGLRPANGRRRYFVTTSPIGWAQAYRISPVICSVRLAVAWSAHVGGHAYCCQPEWIWSPPTIRQHIYPPSVGRRFRRGRGAEIDPWHTHEAAGATEYRSTQGQ